MSLGRLPRELLIQVAGYLEDDKHTLSSISLLPRQFHTTGQEALHRNIKILRESKVHLMRLLRTLIERPDLGRQICSLKLRVFKDEESQNIDSSRHFNIGKLLGQCITYLHQFPTLIVDHDMTQEMDIWMQRLFRRESGAFAALLLTMIPNLKHLDIALLESGIQSNYYPARSPLHMLF